MVLPGLLRLHSLILFPYTNGFQFGAGCASPGDPQAPWATPLLLPLGRLTVISGGWPEERRGMGTGYGLVTYNNNSTANYSAKCNNNAKNNYA